MSKKRLVIAITTTAILIVLTDTVFRFLLIPISNISHEAGMYSIVAYVLSVFVVPGLIAGYGPERKAFFAGALSVLIGGTLGFSIIKILEAATPLHLSGNNFTTIIFGSFIAAIAACSGAYVYGKNAL